MSWITAAVLVPLLAGCSLVYNPSNLPDPRVDGAVIAVDAAPPPVDTNESMLALLDVSPTVLDEGQGDFGSAPALFVIRGQSIVNRNLKVELVPPEGMTVKLAPIIDALASQQADYLAFTVTANVDPALETDVPLTVRVTQDVSAQYGGGTVVKELPMPIMWHGMPELTSATLESNPLTTKLSSVRYSMIDLSDVAMLTLTGAARAELSAVSSIKLAAVVASASGTTPGPEGYAGAMTPGAGPGGGGLGGSFSGLGLGGGGGGGGGGAAADGKAGNPGGGVGVGAGGASGLPAGDEALVSLAGNRASAGGAGGTGNLIGLAPGGAGGGGGGTVVLEAGGDITAASVAAIGGSGTSRDGSGGGGGGGGAGGSVLLTTLNGTLAVDTVNLAGGAGGTPNGGAGSVGRVRWDSPTGIAPAAPGATPWRGPAFTVANRVFTVASPQLTLIGTANRMFDVRVIDRDNTSRDVAPSSFNSSGAATISPLLSPGHNRVCAILANGERGTAAGERCIDVAFLP